MADPFSDNPFAVGSSANQRDDEASNPYASTGAWGSAPGGTQPDANAWGATTTTTNDAYTPSTLPPATGYMGGGGYGSQSFSANGGSGAVAASSAPLT